MAVDDERDRSSEDAGILAEMRKVSGHRQKDTRAVRESREAVISHRPESSYTRDIYDKIEQTSRHAHKMLNVRRDL